MMGLSAQNKMLAAHVSAVHWYVHIRTCRMLHVYDLAVLSGGGAVTGGVMGQKAAKQVTVQECVSIMCENTGS